MNICTMCGINWVPTHLRRFLWYSYLSNPSAKLFVALIREASVPWADAEQAAARLSRYCTVKIIDRKPPASEDPRLLYFDRLRANLPGIFGLSELLYCDTDVDILSDLQYIETLDTAADLLWCRDIVRIGDVRRDLQNARLPPDPIMQIGLMYLRRDMLQDFDAVMQEGIVNMKGFIPGTSVWNIVQKRLEAAGKSMQLATDTQASMWDSGQLPVARTIHFTGQWGKPLHLRCRYLGYPRTMIFGPKPCAEYPGIDL